MTLRHTLGRALHTWCWLGLAVSAAGAQSSANIPASVPAGADSPVATALRRPSVSARDARAADNAYVAGARHVERHEYEAAEREFGHALALNPGNADYLRAFAFAREGRVSALVHGAALARYAGRRADADALLKQAHELDPDNRILEEHLDDGADAASSTFDPLRFPAENIASTLAGAVQLEPDKAQHAVHIQADPQSAIREVFRLWGITVQFDEMGPASGMVKIDLDATDFTTATNLVLQMTKAFAVPLQPKIAMVAHESEENRNRLEPQVEETLYMPGVSFENMQELAQLARDVIGIKNITASGNASTLLVRTDPDSLKVVNSMYADMLDGSSDVMLDMAIYEIDRTKTRNLGVQFPSNFTLFSVASELQNALNANASTLQTAINSGLISQGSLTDNQFKIIEVIYLYKAGLLSSTQSSEVQSLLSFGYLGSIKGLPIAGVTLGSGATLNALLQSSDARLLDTIVLRAASAPPSSGGAAGASGANTAAAQPSRASTNPDPNATITNGAPVPAATAPPATATPNAAANTNPAATPASTYTARFRAGERYPIETSSYTTGGTSSAISSALAGASTAVQQAAAAYLGSSTSVTIPQISFEDLGLTLEATPTIQRNRAVRISLHFKIEALGSGSLNGIPVLNNREFTSSVIIPTGQTAVLTSEVTTNELRSIEGFPGLNELPGFQGTERDAQLSTQELLITLTPHIVRNPKWHAEARAITLPSSALH